MYSDILRARGRGTFYPAYTCRWACGILRAHSTEEDHSMAQKGMGALCRLQDYPLYTELCTLYSELCMLYTEQGTDSCHLAGASIALLVWPVALRVAHTSILAPRWPIFAVPGKAYSVRPSVPRIQTEFQNCAIIPGNHHL